ncbi:MAG: YtxH domain-containing protein [Bacteroidales bacterium]|nr:YtxH domain-containing protein [Bacteroidales bacterium]MCD8394722.1 YtxH domain-containing protein [Bacteroidales bacterium]
MSCKIHLLYAFLGGAIVGAGAALLFAPEKGEELRDRIKEILRKKGICCCSETQVDELVEEIKSISES